MMLHPKVASAIRIAGQVAVIALVILLWQVAADRHAIDVSYFSKPTAVFSYIRAWAGFGNGHTAVGNSLWQDLEATLIVFGVGYAIGLFLGICMGILIGTVRLAREVLEPFLSVFNAVPRLILMPIFIVLFGFGYVPQITLVVAVIVMFVTINIAAGVAETSGVLLSHCTVLGASRWQVIRYVYVPSLTLWVMSTSRVSVGYAVQGSIAAQLIGSDKGLGFRVVDAASSFRSNEMFAAFVVLLVLVLVFDAGLSAVERRATRWMPSPAGR